ncbi:MAG: flagellar biosynthetic protein FliR [Rickettsiaceae bacterium]|nr:flagellar biosynthetic protein FliR [Rickettsiaceae bacterium]
MISELIFSFFIILARISALFTLMPALSDERISLKIRAMASVMMSLSAIPFLGEYLPKYTTSSSLICYYIISEILVGLMISLSVRIIFSSIPILGNIVSLQSGLSAATIYDPAQKEQIALFGSFVVTIALVMIFASDTHILFIKGFLESYDKFRPGEIIDISDFSNHIAISVSKSFLLAFKIGSPFIVVGTSMLVASGVLSRLMPTFQVFFVITPVQILIMFTVLLLVVNQIIALVIQSMIEVF